MAELTNLTDRISHLRDREGSSLVVQGGARLQLYALTLANGRTAQGGVMQVDRASAALGGCDWDGMR